MTPDQMRTVAQLADSFGTGELRTTTMQNVAIINIPDQHVDAVALE